MHKIIKRGVKEKVTFRLIRKLPYIEISALLFYGFILSVCIYKIIKSEAELLEYILLSILCLFLLTGFGYFFSNSYKTLIIIDDKIIIRKWLTGQTVQYLTKDISGFDLKETYIKDGLTWHVRIVIDDSKVYEFRRDHYKNYYKLKPLLQRAGLKFLGNNEIVSKFKYAYSIITFIGAALGLLGFVLIRLI